MPIQLSTQQHFRPLQTLRFCYLCCLDITDAQLANGEINREHVPPTGMFKEADRDVPLILPAHATCNNALKDDDQISAQLMRLIHGRPSNEHNQLDVYAGILPDGTETAAIGGFDFRSIIRRFVRGFHSALYREPIPDFGQFMTSPPLPEAELTPDGPRFLPVEAIVNEFIPELQRHHAAGNVDSVVCRNGKVRYECVWMKADGGQWLCFYSLDINNWGALAPTEGFNNSKCVGAYFLPFYQKPEAAASGERA